jgi:hypothetical protein
MRLGGWATLSPGIEVGFAFGRKQLKFGVPRPLVVSEVESTRGEPKSNPLVVSEAESVAVPTPETSGPVPTLRDGMQRVRLRFSPTNGHPPSELRKGYGRPHWWPTCLRTAPH